MRIVQFVLVAAMVGLLLFFLARRNSMQVRAWKRVALFLLVVVGIVGVLDPDTANRLANAVGVGRGADLLLYMTVMAFIFVSLNVYLKFRDMEIRLVEIARALALLEAGVEKDSASTPSAENTDATAEKIV